MKDQNVYRKLDNGRYQAYGVCYQPEHLPDGIWYVRHNDHSRSTTSIPYIAGLFRVGDSKQIDVPTLCGLEDLCSKITESQEYRDVINNKNGYSINDIIHVCVKILMGFGKKDENTNI